MTRRRFLGAATGGAALVAGGVLPGCSDDHHHQARKPDTELDRRLSVRGPWPVPAAAWSRPIGDYPPGASGTVAPLEASGPPQTRTKRGIPVGGIGTGSFMFNLAGSFGPWELDIGGDGSQGSQWGKETNSGHEERMLPGAAFHLRTAAGDRTDVVTLATEDVLPAWKPLRKGQGRYYALFPKAWFHYDGLPVDASLQQLTPYVARDERWSSTPVGVFRLRVHNPSSAATDVAAMLTYPNAIYRRDTESYRYPRQGLRSSVDHHGQVTGVRLQAEHPDNVPETQRTEWVVAARGDKGTTVTWTDDWAADRDGADILHAFSRAGRLPNAPVDQRRNGLGGAVAAQARLAPGETRTFTFALAWDFPVVQFRNTTDGTRWAKRYTEWYPGGYRGFDIATDALVGAEKLEHAIDGWWEPIAFGRPYPLWLRRAALNELYYDVFGGVFWENGCLSKPKRFGTRKGQHLSGVLEANVYRDYETLDVRHYECRSQLTLFPAKERDLLLGWADLVMDDPAGRTPHDAGSPVDDPWFTYGQYTATSPGAKPPVMNWKDLPSKFVQECHAYWRYTGDDEFLRDVYPATKRTTAYLLSFDHDGDGIPENEGNDTTYDALGLKGNSTYVAALTIGALEAMAAMATRLGHTADAKRYEGQAGRARRSAEQKLWLDEAGYYRTDTNGPNGRAIMSDALNGQRYAEVHGLPDVLDRKRMASHLRQVHRRTVLPYRHGRVGAVNAVGEHGEKLGPLMAQGIWPGGTYFTSALMYRAGKATNDRQLVDMALATAEGVYYTTYEDETMAFWFDTPAIWYPQQPTMYRAQQNERPRAVWELLLEVHDPFPRPG